MPPKFKRGYEGADFERQSLLEGSDDEDFFLKGPNPQTKRLANDDKVNRLQGQVTEVIDVMQDNIGKVLDRGERLEDLQDKSDSLNTTADLFRVRAKGLKNHMWWRECRMRILLAVVVIVILSIIFIPIIVKYSKNP